MGVTKLLIYPLILFSVFLTVLAVTLRPSLNEEVSSNWLIFVSTSPFSLKNQTSLYQLNLDTNQKRLLTDNLILVSPRDIHTATWSPDGRWIYFVAMDKKGNSHLYRRNLNSNSSQLIVSNWGPITQLDIPEPLHWTIDNRWIIYGLGNNHDGYTFYRISPNGANKKKITDNNAHYLTISPDSDWLYYISSPIHRSTIYRVEIDGNRREEIWSGYAGHFLGWSPDGEWLYFNNMGGEPNISRISSDGTQIERLSPAQEQSYSTYFFRRWSPDKSYFIYDRDNLFYIFDLATYQSTFLMIGNDYTIVTMTEDKQWAYVYEPGEGIYQMSTEENPVIDWLIEDNSMIFIQWQPNQIGFYYKKKVNQDTYQLYYFDLATRNNKYLGKWKSSSKYPYSFISPDESYLAFETNDLCWITLDSQQTICSDNNSSFVSFEGWQPYYHPKPCHPNQLLLVASGLLIGLSGTMGYSIQKHSSSH